MRWIDGVRARLRLLFRGAAERRMEEEMRFHLEMETEKNLRAGMTPAEARRRARLAFGAMEGHKEAMRDGRTLAWLGGLSLDLRLGLRMLVKHPGLALVGGLGMALGVAISVAFFSMMASLVYPRLPLEEGGRVVALENRDVEIDDEERRSLHDFVQWRGELKTVRELSAFRMVRRTLATGEGPLQPVEVAEMTAAGFQVARVPPLLGRYLVAEDEREGAPPVLVIGHRAWQRRFAGDPGVVGREVRIGGTVHTVVGVMPEGFAFPVNHQYWTPFRADPASYARRQGPALYIVGRLAPGVTMEEAQAELDVIGRRTAAAFPATHAKLRPMVMPYVQSVMDFQGGMSTWEMAGRQLMMSLLLVVVALNVAVLVYARTATRQGEIAVRSALGASRRRIVAQLFAEALVLSMAAAAAGLALASAGLRFGYGYTEMEMDATAPFWTDYGLRPATLLFTVALAVLAAVIVGVVPALQATGRRMQDGLRQLGGTSMRLGRTWTALVVAQVAIAVAALPAAASLGLKAVLAGVTRPTYAAEELLGVRVAEDAEAPAGVGAAAPGARLTELVRRLEAEPGVAGVTFRATLPGRGRLVRVEDVPAPTETPAGHEVSSVGVRPGYFEVFGARLLAGRGLGAADAGAEARAVVVSQAFARQVLGGGSALGRRIRHVQGSAAAREAAPERWYEIVGVVDDLEANAADPREVTPVLYYPVAPAQATEATLAVRLRGTAPMDFAPRLREVAAAVDPLLQLGTIRSMAETERVERRSARLAALVLAVVMASVFLLSAAGVSALMSFTVTRRRKEIGIRTALGARPMQVLRSVFARAAGQVALGVAVGVALAALLERLTPGALMDGRAALILPGLAVVMALVGLLAALGPARRGLRIQAMEALRAE